MGISEAIQLVIESTSGSVHKQNFTENIPFVFLYHNTSPVENVKGLAVNSPIANQNNNHLLEQSAAIDEYYHSHTHD